MNKISKKIAMATIALVGLVAVAAPADASQCNQFPKLKLWGDYSHEGVQKLVSTRLSGDWNGYLARLDNRLGSIKDIHARGKALALKIGDKRYTLKGKTLAGYIRASEQRLSVVECLAHEAEMAALENFATAAGQEEAPDVELAAIQVGELNLNVAGSCEGGNAAFRVTNMGKAWPKLATVSIYRVGNGEPKRISARRMRFSDGQQATFKVPPAKNPTGRLGLFVDPSWAKRTFEFDATLTCG
ncbi:MAG: hypothetical protein HOH04_10215 [Rhodospirillaceae bacterium]|nr:hypothetical protein [Rhodospirillaceae bacterium]